LARVSAYYRLGRTQPSLDFVDVDTAGDVLVFVDPQAVRLLHSEWLSSAETFSQPSSPRCWQRSRPATRPGSGVAVPTARAQRDPPRPNTVQLGRMAV
jgi:hypothetical protein